MAKFQVGQALAVLGQIQAGRMAGQQQGRQDRERQDAEQFDNTLRALALRKQVEDDERQRALAALGPDPSRIPGLRPEALAALLGPYLQGQQRIQGQPSTIDYSRLHVPAGPRYESFRQAFARPTGRGAAGPGMDVPFRAAGSTLDVPPEQLLPALPAPAASGVAPGAAPGAPPAPAAPFGLQASDFVNPDTELARSGVLRRAQSISSAALQQGNAELATAVDLLAGQVEAGKLDPETANAELTKHYTGLQAKSAAGIKAKQATEIADWLDKLIEKDAVASESANEANAFSARFRSIDPNTPEGLKALEGLQQEYNSWRPTMKRQPSGMERYYATEADRRKAEGFENANKGYLGRLDEDRPPGLLLRDIDQQRGFAAKTKGAIQPYGGEEYDPTPRMVPRQRVRKLTPAEALTGSNEYQASPISVMEPETPQEVQMRRLAVLARDLKNPASKEKAQQEFYKTGFAYLQSANFAALPPEQRDAFVNELNKAGDAIGALDIPKLHPGVSPNVRAQILAQTTQRVLDRNLSRERLGLDRQREARLAAGEITAQQAASEKLARDRYEAAIKQFQAAAVGRRKQFGGVDPEGQEDWTRFDPAKAADDLQKGRLQPTRRNPKTKKEEVNPFYQRAVTAVNLWQASQPSPASVSVTPAARPSAPSATAALPPAAARAQYAQSLRSGGATEDQVRKLTAARFGPQ